MLMWLSLWISLKPFLDTDRRPRRARMSKIGSEEGWIEGPRTVRSSKLALSPGSFLGSFLSFTQSLI